LIFSLVFLASISASAQTTRKVLFLGNSYTGVNNLPQLVKDLAFSAGDTLLFDRNTPGGNTLENHSQNPVSISKIAAGSWDYVILQEQSQRPITNTSKFTQGANRLYDSIKKYNPCATPLLYMTWGRKNGDVNNCPSFPVMCTYQGMDSALRKNYLDLTDNLDAEVSPVSIVWRNLRQNNPNIELYQPDGSHPSAAGSYAAACSFYTAIFKKNPALITFDYSLNATDASIIRNAAKAEVFDSLAKWDYKKTARSGFRYNRVTGVNQLQFSPTSHIVSQSYFWDFGDGFSSTMRNPSHSFATNGSYTVSLTTNTCDWQGLLASTSDTIIQFCSHTPTITSSNPWLCNYDTLWTEPANSYQWYANGQVIPETGRFLANYQAYNSMSFSVASSLNGCSELSEVFAANPPWSGYFFDAAWGGDPCEGDTALFIAKHFNGSLPDSGLVLWYKNGLLLPAATNQDTLLITSQGIYQCRAVDTTTNCPFDTTISTTVVFDCGSLSTEKTRVKESWSLYPNPATESVMLELPADLARSEIRIYNAKGRLVKNLKAAPTQSIDISALPKGLYFIRLQNQDVRVLKFVKE
jgi:hypothetical protein